jgi:iron complex outermembrane receptor protein
MKPLYYKILFTTVLMLGFNTLFAQTAKPLTKVSGILAGDNGKAADYASVSLLKAGDTSIVAGTLSDEAGLYHFDHVSAGNYIIKATSVGYDNILSRPFTISGDSLTFTVAILKLHSSSRNLKEVTVTAARPLIERQLDRTVMNVANSVLAAGNTAMDILARAPGVTVDKDDNISLKGKQGVTIMINDKLTYLSPAQLATLLKSTDGSTIQSIEIISNPSAKYDAAGNSGIINIKLKKNKQEGTNGTATVGGGFGAYGNDNASITLNHKEGNLNVYGSFSRGDGENGRNLNIKRTVPDSAGKPTYFNQYTYMADSYHYNNYNLGADYNISSKNTLGFSVTGYANSDNARNNDQTLIGSNGSPSTLTADSSQRTGSVIKQTYRDFAIDLNDDFKIDTMGQDLSADLVYSKFNNNSNANYTTDFYLADGSQQQPPELLRNETPSSIDIRTAKLDYTKPLTKTIKLETGVKFSDVKTDNNLQAQILNNGTYINDTTQTNRFIYDEKIDAAYVSLSKTYKNTSVQAGLRAEYTSSTGNLVTDDTVAVRKYFNLFPSLFINHTINDKNELSFSYSRRIDRPNYSDLNPFIYYLDQYTYSQGNPFLRPQYTNNFEFDYTYNKTINLSLNYSHTTDAITEIILTNVARKATYQTNLNLQTQNGYNISVNAPYTVSKWWTGNIDATAFYMGFKSDSLFGGNLNDGQWAYQLKATETFLFSGFKLEVYSDYQSAMTYGIYHLKPRYSTDAGISRSFDNKKLNIKFAVDDIFNTRRNDLSANYQNDDFIINQKSTTRAARLTLTYNFGNTQLKSREHRSGAEDESRRVSGGN